MCPTMSLGEQIVQCRHVQGTYSASLHRPICYSSLVSIAIKMKFKVLNRSASVHCISFIITRTLLILPETPSEKK